MDTEVIKKIAAAAKLRRESASKWLEDAALQRLQRIMETPEESTNEGLQALPKKQIKYCRP